MTDYSPRWTLCAHSQVRIKKNSYCEGIMPQHRRSSAKYLFCAKNITWDRTEVEYCRIIVWFKSNITCCFISKNILWCMYDVSHRNLIGILYNIIFADEGTKSNYNTIQLLYMILYRCKLRSNTYYFYCFDQYLHCHILWCI